MGGEVNEGRLVYVMQKRESFAMQGPAPVSGASFMEVDPGGELKFDGEQRQSAGSRSATPAPSVASRRPSV